VRPEGLGKCIVLSLEYNDMQSSESQLTLKGNISPSSRGSKNKSRKTPA
jgi:hypothetical protein